MSPTGKGGVIMGALSRMAAGSSMLLTNYASKVPDGMVTFCTDSPGKILPIQLQAGQSVIAHTDTFLVAEHSITLEATTTKSFGAGIFGRNGFILQKVTGPGTFFAQISGDCEEYTLAAGQLLKVHAGHVALFDSSVDFD